MRRRGDAGIARRNMPSPPSPASPSSPASPMLRRRRSGGTEAHGSRYIRKETARDGVAASSPRRIVAPPHRGLPYTAHVLYGPNISTPYPKLPPSNDAVNFSPLYPRLSKWVYRVAAMITSQLRCFGALPYRRRLQGGRYRYGHRPGPL
jgi:hypothetical protein